MALVFCVSGCCRGKISCKRLWQIGMEHSPAEDEYYEDDQSEAEVNIGGPKTICSWLKGPGDGQLARGSTGLWVNVFDSSPNPGKVRQGPTAVSAA